MNLEDHLGDIIRKARLMTNVAPVIVSMSRDWSLRSLELWPDGSTPGNINHLQWTRGVGGSWTNIILIKLTVPPQGSTNLVATWDAQGIASTNTVPNMLHPAEFWYRDWGSYLSQPGYDYKDKMTTKVDLNTGGYPLSVEEHLYVITVHYLGVPSGLLDGVPGDQLFASIATAEVATVEVTGTFSRAGG